MPTALQNNLAFQFMGTLTTAGNTVDISVDIERGLAVTFTDAYITISNRANIGGGSRRGLKIERCKGTAAAGVLTLSLRGLDQSDTDTEVPALKKEWKEGVTAYITIFAVQLVNKQGSNTYPSGTLQTFDDIDVNGDATFDGTIRIPIYADATARNTAIPSPSNGMEIYNTAVGKYQDYTAGSWVDRESGGTFANASLSVAGKVQAPSQTQTEQLATVGSAGALLFVTPTTINPSSITAATPDTADKISFSDTSDSNYLKSCTIQALMALGISFFGDGSDGDVVINSGTTTLTRDMFYNNLTVTSPGILDPAGYRIFILGTFTGTGTVRRPGNAGGAGGPGGGSQGTAGAAATTLGQGSLNAEIASVAGGIGNGASGTTGTASTTSLSNVNGVAGGNGGGVGPNAGAGGTTTRGSAYNQVFKNLSLFLHYATGGSIALANYKGGASSGGGGGGGGNGSGGGGGGGNGGTLVRIYNTIPNDATITLTGGAGGAAGGNGAGPNGGGGGGSGGNGGVIWIACKVWNFTGLISAIGGAGGAGGASSYANGSAGTTGATGATISIVV